MSSSHSESSTSSPGKKIQEKKPFSLFLPFVIIAVGLIVSTARDTATIQKQKMAFLAQNQKSADVLNLSAKQMDAVQKLHDDLQTLAKSDPGAAKIVAEYFPPAPAQGQGSPAVK